MKNINQTQKNKIWIMGTCMLTIISFLFIAAITVYIDPLFHFHAPLEKYEYPITDQRYQNDGITRHFEYDSIITGTSMTQNFKTTEADSIFNANFIKVPFSGAHYKEINDCLQRAYDYGKNLKYVIRCLDYSMLIDDKDAVQENVEYPAYLYNDNLFDDINYVLNKSILFDYTCNVIDYTKSGNKTTTFDDYANWMPGAKFGADHVFETYKLGKKSKTSSPLTNKTRQMMVENLQQNVTALTDAHPETTFYMFFPPYSICYWDSLQNDGYLDRLIDAEQLAIEELLKCSNIKLYSFCNNFEMVCDLDNYRDQAHYGEWINSDILEWMHNDEYLLTEENYLEYLDTKREFYSSYDYDSLHNTDNK